MGDVMAPTNEKARSTIQSVMRRYYTVWGMYSFAGGFLFGVYPLFLRSRGLTQFQINSVLATYFVVLFLTDVPTGAFADALGRRRSYVLGAALRVCAFVMYFFAHHYIAFLVAESVDGIGTTFGNGAIDAWGVDALDDSGYIGSKDKLFSRLSQLNSLGFMGSAMIGAYVADINIAYPWLLGASGYLISGIVGAFLMHDERRHAVAIKLTAMPAQVAERVAGGLRSGFSARNVLMLSAAGAIAFAAWAPYWVEWPILFNSSFNVGVWIIGWIYCALAIARMLGAEVVSRLYSDDGIRATRVTGLVVTTGMALSIAGLCGGMPWLMLVVLFVMNLSFGALQPLLQSWFNEQIDSGQRATLLSFNSTFQTAGGSMGLLANGRIADAYGIPVAWQAAGLLSMFAAPIYWMLRPRAETAVIAASEVE
jgi:MFS family permease